MKVVITSRNYNAGESRGIEILTEAGLEIEDYSNVGLSVGADEETIFNMVKDADFILAGIEPYPGHLIERCPNLKLISRRGIGFDAVDLEACRKHNVVVCRTLGAVEGSVAEIVMAYILYFARRVDLQNASMQKGEWQRMLMPAAKSTTLGLVGFGGIGKELAMRARPFGMKILYYSRNPRPEWEEEYGVSYADLDTLLACSDYVSVNVPLTENTRGMFGEKEYAKMKKGSVFINIARGPVADAFALRKALDSGHLSGAALDVYDREPCTDSPLIGCDNVILTPHTATFTNETFAAMNNLAAQNIVDFINGKLDEYYIVR